MSSFLLYKGGIRTRKLSIVIDVSIVSRLATTRHDAGSGNEEKQQA